MRLQRDIRRAASARRREMQSQKGNESMNDFYELDFEKGEIREFERRMIAECCGDRFFEMGMVEKDDKDTVTYRTEDYMPLAAVSGTMYAGEGLGIVSELLEALLRAEECLIPPRRLKISGETVWVDRERQSLRLLFVPEKCGNSGVYDKLSDIMAELRQSGKLTLSQDLRDYFTAIEKAIDENRSAAKLRKLLSQLRREAYLTERE